jgi:hypothetical protein
LAMLGVRKVMTAATSMPAPAQNDAALRAVTRRAHALEAR